MTKLPNFSGKAFLAPMAGITDPAMRLLCKQMGAALVATELTSIHSIIAQSAKKRLQEFLQFSDEERPLSIQLFGSDITHASKLGYDMLQQFWSLILGMF